MNAKNAIPHIAVRIHIKSTKKTKKHTMSSDEYKKYLSQRARDSMMHGEENELFMLNLFKTLDFEDVIHSGNSANTFDIFVKFRDEDYYRGIQVKTLSYYLEGNCYVITSNKAGYDNDTLIVGVSNAKDKYTSMFFRDMKEYTRFSAKHNVDRLYDNLDLFKIKLFEMAHRSTIVFNFNDYLPPPEVLEAESVNRFRNKCNVLGIPFRPNTTNSNEIDAFVNEYRVQFKSSRMNRNDKYTFNLHRDIGSVIRTYDENDNVDFFIFETADEIHQNNFFIIPKKVLIKLKYISTFNSEGKFTISISWSDDYHWTSQFLNRFDQINMGIDIMLIYNDLHNACLYKNLQCEFGKRKIISINSHKILHINSSQRSQTSYIFSFPIQKRNQSVIRIIDEGYSFVIFEFSAQYWIIPIEILVKHGYITTDNHAGKCSISIQHGGPELYNWIEYYNNFDQLK